MLGKGRLQTAADFRQTTRAVEEVWKTDANGDAKETGGEIGEAVAVLPPFSYSTAEALVSLQAVIVHLRIEQIATNHRSCIEFSSVTLNS